MNDEASMKIKLRVMGELRDAGFGVTQLRCAESKKLVEVIEADEHIIAAVYGHVLPGGSVIMVATNKRIIYINHLPFLDILDEFNYIAISGISYSTNGFFWSVTLHSGVDDRTLGRIKAAQAKKFVNYIESKCIDQPYSA